MIPKEVQYLIVGAGIHGLSTAWRIAERLIENGESVEDKVLVIDKSGIASGASGIACGVVRNNYFQPAMRNLMAHSVNVWESDPKAFSYHPVGYMQVSCESMREDVGQIFSEQQSIGYESVFIEGEDQSMQYMKNIFSDWQAKGITSVLHEKKGGYANNTKSIYGLAKKAEELGVRIISGIEVKEIQNESASKSVKSVVTNKGNILCEHLIVGAGPWVRDFWNMLELPKVITVKDLSGITHDNVDMWRFWQLEEGVLQVEPELLKTNNGKMPPVIHVDTDAPLISDVDGSVITEEMWGIYYKPDWHFNGIQGGASPYKVKTPVDEVAIDPYGPSSPEFISGGEFSHMWVSALAHCQKRFSGQIGKYKKEPSGGIGAFTPDSFPVFDSFKENCFVIADSNHGYKMLGVGKLVAEAICGQASSLLNPFRFSRYEEGDLHPVSNSPFPWS